MWHPYAKRRKKLADRHRLDARRRRFGRATDGTGRLRPSLPAAATLSWLATLPWTARGRRHRQPSRQCSGAPASGAGIGGWDRVLPQQNAERWASRSCPSCLSDLLVGPEWVISASTTGGWPSHRAPSPLRREAPRPANAQAEPHLQTHRPPVWVAGRMRGRSYTCAHKNLQGRRTRRCLSHGLVRTRGGHDRRRPPRAFVRRYRAPACWRLPLAFEAQAHSGAPAVVRCTMTRPRILGADRQHARLAWAPPAAWLDACLHASKGCARDGGTRSISSASRRTPASKHRSARRAGNCPPRGRPPAVHFTGYPWGAGRDETAATTPSTRRMPTCSLQPPHGFRRLPSDGPCCGRAAMAAMRRRSEHAGLLSAAALILLDIQNTPASRTL